MTPKLRLTIIRIVVLVGLVVLTVYLLSIRDRIKELEGYGYPGIFLVSILANATIIVPLPGVLITSAMGAVFHPFWVAVAAGSGAALGELSGYMAGFSGQMVIENARMYERMVGWMKKYGDIVIVLLAFIPNPAFDLAGMIAGALKMRVWKFLLFCWVGKIGKMLLFAYAGSSILNLFSK
jgi:uncharacterized membrane protein YdjX (TVP38/TMEM64 family)